MNARLVHCCHFFRAGAVATAITALALAPVTKATEQLTNRSFDQAGGVGWSVEPYTSPTPPYTAWEPFAIDGEVDLYRKYSGTDVKMLWQVLDISNVSGVSGTASMKLKIGDLSNFPNRGTSSTKVYLDYLDESGSPQRMLLLSPDNNDVPHGSEGQLFSTSFDVPPGAQKITGFSVDRTFGGYFYAMEFSLDLQAPAPQLPAIAVENDGTPLTSNGGHTWMGQSVVGVPASTVTFTVKNTGTQPLTLSEVTVEGTDAGDFGVTQPDVTSVLPQESTTFTVTFTPSAADERLATLNIVSNDTPNSPFIINLTGNGMMPRVTLTSPLADSSIVGGAAIALEAVVESFGASISKVEFYDGETLIGTGVCGLDGYWSFPDGSSLSVSVMYDSLDVYDAANGCMYYPTSGSFTSPLTWQGTLYSSVLETEFQAAIDFTHGSDNTLNAQLSGTDGQSVTLTGGIGFNPKFTLSWPHASAGTHELTARVFYGAERSEISAPETIHVEATPVIGVEQPADTALTSGSSSVDFGSSYPGMPLSLDFTVKNTGNATLNDIVVTLEGTNAGDYALTTTPADSLLEGKAMTFTVTFTPSTTGSLPATLSIASNDTTNTPFTISLMGYGMDPPQVTLTSPLADASFATGEVIALEATVETFGGSVTGLEFYDGETLIGSGQIGLYGGWSYPDGSHLAVMAGESGTTVFSFD
jgi:hypothetical protein